MVTAQQRWSPAGEQFSFSPLELNYTRGNQDMLYSLVTWPGFHLSFVDTSPVGISPVGHSSSSSSSLLTRQLQESWRSLRGLSGGSSVSSVRWQTDSVLFEVTDASVVQDGSSKYVVSWQREKNCNTITKTDIKASNPGTLDLTKAFNLLVLGQTNTPTGISLSLLQAAEIRRCLQSNLSFRATESPWPLYLLCVKCWCTSIDWIWMLWSESRIRNSLWSTGDVLNVPWDRSVRRGAQTLCSPFLSSCTRSMWSSLARAIRFLPSSRVGTLTFGASMPLFAVNTASTWSVSVSHVSKPHACCLNLMLWLLQWYREVRTS